MTRDIHLAAQWLSRSGKTVALTGAGISVESGIPPFRGKGGLWEKFDPFTFAHIDSFLQHPEMVWREFLAGFVSFLGNAEPGDGHRGMAKLEAMGILKTVITQNVDGLHQKAGNTDVIEFHGTFATFCCLNCLQRFRAEQLNLAKIPPRCNCGGMLRPECIFFGEAIPTRELLRSHEAASSCDIMLVVGTSAVVEPAAYVPVIAKNSGAKVIEINPEPTPLTGAVGDIFLQGKAGDVIQGLVHEISMIRGPEVG